MWLLVLAVLGSVGCYQPPDLEPVKDIPIVPVDVCQPPRQERVQCVIDGDTFDVGVCGDSGERIRMLGIDAPEVAHEGDPAECFGEIARDELARLTEQRTVTLSFDEDCEGAFGRTLAYMWLHLDDAEQMFTESELDELLTQPVGDEMGVLINQYLLLDGFAVLYDEEFADDLILMEELRSAEAEAIAKGAGLWSQCGLDDDTDVR